MSRIVEALRAADVTDAEITERVVTNDTDAHALGMHGSPTILIDGRDRFVETGTHPVDVVSALPHGGRARRCPECRRVDRSGYLLNGSDLWVCEGCDWRRRRVHLARLAR